MHFALLPKIQAGDPTRKPLFLVHSIFGQITFYRELARAISKQTPIYAFRAPSLDEASQAINNIELMTSKYIQALPPSRTKGYILGGSSFDRISSNRMSEKLKVPTQTVTTQNQTQSLCTQIKTVFARHSCRLCQTGIQSGLFSCVR